MDICSIELFLEKKIGQWVGGGVFGKNREVGVGWGGC